MLPEHQVAPQDGWTRVLRVIILTNVRLLLSLVDIQYLYLIYSMLETRDYQTDKQR